MTAAHSADTDLGEVDTLRARLRVEPPSTAGCELLSAATDHGSVRQSLSCPDNECPDQSCECHAEVASSDEPGRPKLLSREVTSSCVCRTFRNHACVSEMDSVQNGELVFSVTIQGREELRDIVAELRETGATVRLQRLVDLSSGDCDGSRIDDTPVTDKQREAIRTAYELGYYETPRESDLGDVADELGISKSAASQRLNAVASKLVVGLLQTEDAAGSDSSPPAGVSADD
ncbi:helix-turn-helix domain-containing protein [Natranaeroarchaeum aerophilus]|uniref:Helix-turn-helix domain-containing protein n=1 Tax=Natranaeroarchaeum aerophilus TaxID=2917711 RepID=A0AAE3FNI3_9EURY|nr:helix-turn-helix domain-containing protein [Natranaeroarchaeum aerophilus]MCL9812717.1 helix-turn-helix domain-containing protein [Natranaeroarchaeum aerophilus]